MPVPAGKSAGEFHEPTQADDVYAFGALMVEMVTGDPSLATLGRGLKYTAPYHRGFQGVSKRRIHLLLVQGRFERQSPSSCFLAAALLAR